MTNVHIIGAGLAGLLAACKFPEAKIYEAGKERTEHRALLRFRDDSVSRLTGIPFKRVEVQKGVWDSLRGALITDHCGFDLQNQYAKKVTGNLVSRSIRDLSPSVRYIAPDDFHQQLIDRFRDRISFEHPMTGDTIRQLNRSIPDTVFISTAPMKVMLNELNMNIPIPMDGFRFEPESIVVARYKLKFDVSDVYQTVYFPNASMQVYRASITGDTLIVEGVNWGDGSDIGKKSQPAYYAAGELKEICRAFGLSVSDVNRDTLEVTEQKFGKIIPLNKDLRETIMYEMTRDNNVFSLGRFACWRSILLDDVAQDIDKIDGLIRASAYSRKMQMFSQN